MDHKLETQQSIYADKSNNNTSWFFFMILYLFIDLGRPQDMIPIGFLRPGMISILILVSFLIFGSKDKLFNASQIKLVCYFILLTAVYIPFARNNFFAYNTTKSMLLFLPFIFSCIICLDSIDRLRKFMFFWILIMNYIALYSLTHSGCGSGNYFSDENDLALYMNICLPFCYFLFLYEKEKIKKIFFGISGGINLLAIVKSFSRGGFLGLLSLVIVVWLLSKRKLITLISICLLGIFLYFIGGERYRAEMSTISTEDTTGLARIESWKAGWRMFLDKPWGVGGNNFLVWFHEYQSEYFNRGMWGRASHSLWFTLIPELGILGILIYLALLYYNVKDLWLLKDITNKYPSFQYVRYLALAYLTSIMGYFMAGSFLSVLYYPYYWYLTAMIVATRKISTNASKEIQCINDSIG